MKFSIVLLNFMQLSKNSLTNSSSRLGWRISNFTMINTDRLTPPNQPVAPLSLWTVLTLDDPSTLPNPPTTPSAPQENPPPIPLVVDLTSHTSMSRHPMVTRSKTGKIKPKV